METTKLRNLHLSKLTLKINVHIFTDLILRTLIINSLKEQMKLNMTKWYSR